MEAGADPSIRRSAQGSREPRFSSPGIHLQTGAKDMRMMTMFLLSALPLALGCQDTLEPVAAAVPERLPAYAVTEVELESVPDADTYVSSSQGSTNFGTETSLKLGKDRSVLVRWDSATLANLIGDDSLVSAFVEMDVVANGGGWGQGKFISIHALTWIWAETEVTWTSLNLVQPPWAVLPLDTETVGNGYNGIVTFDVTASVRAALSCPPPGACLKGNGWLIRVASSGNPSLEFGSRESANPPRLVLTVQSQTPPVPAVAPDSIPAGLLDESNLLSNAPCVGGPMVRDVILLSFRIGTTQPQRQAAVDSVGGSVIGGIRFGDGDGWYLLRIDDDGTGQGICDAIQLLDGMAQVTFAHPYFMNIRTLHRQPTDGLGWRRGEWLLDPTLFPSGIKWGVEAIAAPLAWGCTIGNSDTPVAVVDMQFRTAMDMENVAAEWRTFWDQPGDAFFHGTSIASILAARGNNQQMMTGVMWEADLRTYDVREAGRGRGPAAVADAIETAARDGARVVNVSLGVDWSIAGLPHSDTSSFHHRIVAGARDALVEAIRRLPPSSRPLVVISAGNDSLDAYWSGFAAAADSFPDNVLVVAASTANGTLWSGSNDGILVDIAAPGFAVGAIDSTGAVNFVPGFTSAAAAYASGVAGLLAAFDPDLAPGEIKALILEGAARGAALGMPQPGGFNLLNAYEALRAAAERPGAPLCGNHVWTSGDELRAVRGSGTQLLAEVGSPVGWLEVLHGGKDITYVARDASGQPVRRFLTWNQAGTWSQISAPDDTVNGGTLLSTLGRSHDADSIAFVQDSLVNVPDSGTRWYDTQSSEDLLIVFGPTDSVDVVGTLAVPNLPEPISNLCVIQVSPGGECLLTVFEIRHWRIRLAYPQFPDGGVLESRTALISVSAEQLVPVDSSITDWHTCNFDPSLECREFQSRFVHRGARVYTHDLTSPFPPVPVDSFANESVYWIAQGESGRDIVLGRGSWDRTHRFSPEMWVVGVPAESPGFFDFADIVNACRIEYRQRQAFSMVIGSPIMEPTACARGQFAYTGTIDPFSGAGTIAPRAPNPFAGQRMSIRAGRPSAIPDFAGH